MDKLKKIPAVLSHVYTLFFVLVSWAIFAIEDFGHLVSYLKVMFGLGGVPLANGDLVYYAGSYLPILCVAGFFVGYAIFFFAEVSIILIAAGAVLVFIGQAFIQTLMLMFLADTVEYGQWKLGKRNESITFSIQPFINKIGGAIATGIVSLTLILSGIKVDGGTVDAIGADGKLIIKAAMFVIPLIMIVVGYIVYLKKYKISEEFYSEMLKEIEAREAE